MSRPTVDGSSPPSTGSLLVIFLTVFIDLLGFGLVLPLLPVYADQYAVDPQGWQLGLLMASFSLMQFLFAPLWGNLSDRVGRRPVLMIGLAGSCAFYAVFAAAALRHSLPLLFLSRVGAGIAGATIPTAQAYIADTTPPGERARGMALIGMAFGLGFTLGPLLGMLALPSGRGDPGALPGFIAAGLSLIALLAAAWALPESRDPRSTQRRRRWLDPEALRAVRDSRAILLILACVFFVIFSFAKFETTLSLLVKGSSQGAETPFHFSWQQLCGTYALIGFTLALIQGGIVRPLARRVSEAALARAGVVCEIVGFATMIAAIGLPSVTLLFAAILAVVSGSACLQPSLQSLISRHAPPEDQGLILGLNQSVNALGRIAGSAIAIPLLKANVLLPYGVSAALMAGAAGLLAILVRIPLPPAGRHGDPHPG